MTTFMKIEAITYCILKVVGYAFGIIGAIMVIGATGSLELDTITIGQYFLYEFYAFGLIGLSYIVYIIRELILEDCRVRYRRRMKRYEARRHARCY